jgi:AAA ATPase domain
VDCGGAWVPSVFARYRHGVTSVRGLIGLGTENLPAIISKCDALDEKLDVTGDSDQLRRDRNAIIYDLDHLTLAALGQSFREICGLGYSYDDWRTAPADLAARLHYAEFGSITEDHMGGQVGFVGREKLMERIHKTVNGYDTSGYTVITGEPGIGKSAVMAQLIRSERWTHHYVGGSFKHGRAIIESICAQLVWAYDLSYDGQLYTETDPCGALNQLLDAATRDRSNWPVVIVIDGFDESDDLQFGTLSLPQNLPSGAFIVVTRKPPGAAGHLFAEHIQPVEIRNDDENKADLRSWVGRFICTFEEARSAIAAFGKSEDDFTEDLVQRSAGNFMYATSILPNIRDRLMTPSDLSGGELPERLHGYYKYQWDRMQNRVGKSNFDRYFIPVASLLTGRSARYGPVTISWLAERSGLQRHEVMGVLKQWSQFLVQEGTNKELVRIYHSSFRDFLAKNLPSEDSVARRTT